MRAFWKPLLAAAVVLLAFASTTFDCSWCSRVSLATPPEPPLRFVRTGPQRHLLVLSDSNASAVQKTRQQLQQMAANHGWFLYHASVRSRSSLFDARALAQFNDVVLNQLPRNKLSKTKRSALRRFVDNGGKVTEIVGDLRRGSLE